MEPLLANSKNTVTVEIEPTEHFEVSITENSFKIESFFVWCESFQIWKKQDIEYLFRCYPTEYERVSQKIELKLNEMGAI